MTAQLALLFSQIVGALTVVVALFLASKILRIRVSKGKLLLMGIASYFLTPIIASYFSSALTYFIPPLLWILLGELLLTDNTRKERASLALLAYIIYLFLLFSGILGFVFS